MPAPASDDAAAAAVFDFIGDYLDDVEVGRERPLSAYLARWPGHEEAIAAEYLRQRGRPPAGDGPPAGDAQGSRDREGDDEPRRVGPYRLVRELGSGGQGSVWLADDTRIARRVALKLLPGLFVTEERRARLRREAESVSRLAHPGICATFEAEVEGETPYIALQYVPGQTVAASLAALLEAGDGPRVEPLVPWRPRDRTELARVLHFFERAARALHAAHEAGLVHRDIKPGNVMVNPQGEPVLLDFGLARDAGPGDATLTRSGEVFGTPEYMSPEQLAGEELDRRTDVYSLGVTLYETLTGERPFGGGSRLALEQAVRFGSLPDPRAANPCLTDDVRAVLETATAKERERRYPSALELAEDLRRIREFEPVRARPASTALRLRRWTRRQPALAGALSATFLTLVGGLLVSLVLLARANANLSRSYGRQFTRRAAELAATNPSAALALGIEAVERVGDHQARSVLFEALEACHLERALDIRPEARFGARIYDLAVGPAGWVVAVSNLTEAGPDRLPLPAGGVLAAWDLQTGRRGLMHRLPDVPRRVALHPSGRVAAVGTDAGGVLALELETGRVLFESRPGAAEAEGERAVRDLVFSPDGASLLVQLATSGTLRLRFPDGSVIARFASAPGTGRVRLSPDGAHVLTAGDPEWPAPALPDVVQVWTPRGTPVARLEHPAAVQQAAWTADGRVVTACGRELRLWSAQGELLEQQRAPFAVACLAPAPGAPDGPVAVTGVEEPEEREDVEAPPGVVALWTPGGGWRELGRHAARVVHAAWSPDGARLASTGWDLATRVWEGESGRLLKTCRETFRPLATRWSLDGSRLVTMSLGWRAYVWSALPMPYLYRLEGHAGPLRWAAFDPDGARAWTAGEDGTLRAFATPAGGAPAARTDSGAPLARWPVHPGGVRLARLSADGARALTAGVVDGTACLSDLESGAPLARVELAADAVDAGLAPDGRAGWVLEAGGTFVFLDVTRGDVRRVPTAATRVALSPDGARLATFEESGRVHLRDARDGRVLATWAHPLDVVADLAWGPTGELAVVAHRAQEGNRPRLLVFSPEGELRVERSIGGGRATWSPRGRAVLGWDERFGNRMGLVDLERPDADPVRPLEVSQIGLTAVVFSPDGEWVASASRDGSVLVWSTRDGEPLVHHTAHRGAVDAVAFAPDGGDLRLVSAGDDGAALVWPADPLPAARARLPRPLDVLEQRAEWRLATGQR